MGLAERRTGPSYRDAVDGAPFCEMYGHARTGSLGPAHAIFRIQFVGDHIRRQYCGPCAIEFIQNVLADLEDHGEV